MQRLSSRSGAAERGYWPPAAMSDEEENALAGDARMEWMEGRIANALRCKADAISKMKIDETSMYACNVAPFSLLRRAAAARCSAGRGGSGGSAWLALAAPGALTAAFRAGGTSSISWMTTTRSGC